MKEPMKMLLVVAFLGLTLPGCKKDTSPNEEKEPLLSRATYNGMIAYKFSYSDKKLLTRWDFYNVDVADNNVTSYLILNYNADDQLHQVSTFDMPGDVPRSRIIFEYDSTGKLKGHLNYDLEGPNPSAPASKGVYTINAQGLISSATIRDKNGELIRHHSLSYYPNGFLKERNSYDETITNQLRLVDRVLYSIPNTDNIKGWENLAAIPLDGDEFTRKVRYESIQRYEYNNGVLQHNVSEHMGGREYNPDGTLKRIVSTTKAIFPPGDDLINNWDYEYVHQ